ncbi:MAG: DUF4167 domain-containing protein [Pseudomonadota bacterium]
MRSSKSRSRSKSNRNRSMGNIVNRVFDSSGPEGKVRGTPQQIIDKYNQLARDAQLAGDRVATENFQQHAEHYTRLLSEAQREQEARREANEQRNGNNGAAQGQSGQNGAQNGGQNGSDDQPQARVEADEAANRPAEPQDTDAAAPTDPGAEAQPDVGSLPAFVTGESDSGLVETPEDSSPKPRRQRRPRNNGTAKAAETPATETPAAETPEGDVDSAPAQDAAE